jgi:hypothetical protein
MKTAPPASTDIQAHVEKLQDDPPFMLEAMRLSFDKTGDDTWVRKATGLCIKSGIKFPGWIIDYLKDWAERGDGEKACGRPKKARDHELTFALAFARLIDGGATEPEARAAASEVLGSASAGAFDDRTLQMWINKLLPVGPNDETLSRMISEMFPGIDETLQRQLFREAAHQRKRPLTEFYSRADVLDLLGRAKKSD